MNRPRMKTLWGLTKGHRAKYLAAILAMGVSHVFLFGVPLVSKTAIDGIVGSSGFEASTRTGALLLSWAGSDEVRPVLTAAGVAIILLTLAGGVFLYLRGRWAASASEAIVRDLRDRVFAHLERLPCRWHDGTDTGDLVQRCTSDVETVRVFLSGQIVEIGRANLLLFTALPILISLDPIMTLVSVGLFPPIVAFAISFFRKVQRLFLLTDEAEGRMTAVLQENLTGIRVVRAFARQDFESDKFAEANAEFRDRNNRLIELLGAYWAISDVLCFTQMGLTLGFGAWWMMQGNITVGTLFAFLTYQAMVIWPVRHMGRVLTDTGKALVALGRLGEVLDAEEESSRDDTTAGGEPVAGAGTPASSERARGDLEVSGLTYAYGKEPVLRDISFSIEAGSTLALVGPPGSGKSTLVHLLLRLYDYETGEIRLDGRELRELDRAWVRSQCGAVLQEPFLYSRTIEANVRVGRTEAALEEVVEATTAADIHGSITEFESGYDTLVGERGVTLSGGQRQRLAIARALLKDPPILILDDALSAVDTGTEARILDALRHRHGRHTTIVIAHRLSSVAAADRILVLDEGRVVQDGAHDTLIREVGPYRRLWEIQGALESEAEQDLQLAAGEDRERGKEEAP